MTPEDYAAMREDIGYIKAKVDLLVDDRKRITSLEKKVWAFPGLALVALAAAKMGLPIPHA